MQVSGKDRFQRSQNLRFLTQCEMLARMINDLPQPKVCAGLLKLVATFWKEMSNG